MNELVDKIKNAAIHAGFIDEEAFFNSVNSTPLTNPRKVFAYIAFKEGVLNRRQISEYLNLNRCSGYFYVDYFERNNKFDFHLSEMYKEALRYLNGNPTPHAERVARINESLPSPTKSTVAYRDDITGLTVIGANGLSVLYGMQYARNNSYIRSRFKFDKVVGDRGGRPVKHIPTGATFLSAKDAAIRMNISRDVIVRHIAGRSKFKTRRREWCYA